jgi:anti-sigma factor RsiW
MNCREFHDLLQQSLDGVVAPEDKGAELHLHDCPACAARHRAARRLNDSLRRLVPPALPAYFTAKATSAGLRAIRYRRFVRRATFAGALAAGVLLAFTLRFYFRTDAPAVPEREIARKPIETPAPASVPVEPGKTSPPLRNTVAEASEAVATLTSRTAGEAMGQTRLLLPIVTGPSLNDLTLSAPDASAGPLRDAGQNISAGLGPVATSARRAVDLFIRDIPPVGGPVRDGL